MYGDVRRGLRPWERGRGAHHEHAEPRTDVRDEGAVLDVIFDIIASGGVLGGDFGSRARSPVPGVVVRLAVPSPARGVARHVR